MAYFRRQAKASEDEVKDAVRACAWPLRGESSDYEPLLDAVSNRSIVLLGAATEGSHEFFRERMALTQRLIVQKGFNTVATLGGWSEAYRIDRYVKAAGGDSSAESSLGDLQGFGRWPWRNADILELVGWLRSHNDGLRPAQRKASFLGLDMYNLPSLMESAARFLERRDPGAASDLRQRFSGFDCVGEGPWQAGELNKSWERQIIEELINAHRRGLIRHAIINYDDNFVIEQSARLVDDAPEYFRSLLSGRAQAWNAYEEHLAKTVEALPPGKIVVWAPNGHAGDASATSMSRRRMTSLAQLLKRKFAEKVFCVGALTYQGTVTAASEWNGTVRDLSLKPAEPGSYEALFHESGPRDFLLMLDASRDQIKTLRGRRRERAVGDVYCQPQESATHYFEADLPAQFDAVLYLDRTRAVEPERETSWEAIST